MPERFQQASARSPKPDRYSKSGGTASDIPALLALYDAFVIFLNNELWYSTMQTDKP